MQTMDGNRTSKNTDSTLPKLNSKYSTDGIHYYLMESEHLWWRLWKATALARIQTLPSIT